MLALAAPTPTPPADARTLVLGVLPWSGECGGELKLPGEEASSPSMAGGTRETGAGPRLTIGSPKSVADAGDDGDEAATVANDDDNYGNKYTREVQ